MGLVDVLAGDNHGDDRSLGAAYRHFEAAGHAAAATQLCSAAALALLKVTAHNPEAVVEALHRGSSRGAA